MAHVEPENKDMSLYPVNNAPRRPRILLAASGSVAAIKFANLCHCFSDWADVKAVATQASLHFVDRVALPKDVILYTDDDEWSSWKKIGDNVLHIELRKWADIMVIAPLSANTLAKIAGGLCDNLLSCVVRAWDYSKPMFVAPAMNTLMWNNPFTERHLMGIDDLGISLIPPVKKRLACGDYGNGAMAEPSQIYSTARELIPTVAGAGASTFSDQNHRKFASENEAEEVVGGGGADAPLEILGAPQFGGAGEAEDAGEEVQAHRRPRQLPPPPPRSGHVPVQVVVARRLHQGAEHAAPVPRREAEDQDLRHRVQLGRRRDPLGEFFEV